jgi:ABC-type transport system involved in multi-copper enzyme maturation permease subunit
LVGLFVAALLSVLFTFLVANGTHEGSCTGPPPPGSGPNHSPGSNCHAGHPFVPTGPDGEPVADSYYFLNQPLTGKSIITAEVTSLTGVISTEPANVAPSQTSTRRGLAAWAKAGILVTPSTNQGSAYAAVMATGSHGVRWQYDYTHDSPGLPGSMTDTSPRWLRLTRTGDTLTGYDSTNGITWTQIGTTRLAGLPTTVSVGLFVASPVSFQDSNNGSPTLATATFDRVSIGSRGGAGAVDAWHGQSIGNGSKSFYPTLGTGGYHRSGSAFVLSGSGDIAPGVGEGLLGADTAASSLPLGLIAGLLVMVVVSTTFITTEYRRDLIRTTFTATPNRATVLAAKAVVIGVAAFVIAAISAAVAIPLSEHILKANGDYVFPASALTEIRIMAGCAGLVAVTAVAVLALGAILRRGAGAVTVGIVVFVLPYTLKQVLAGSADEWLFRLTPAAGLDVLGALPRSAHVAYPYTLGNGYYPLTPWAGIAVLCAWVAIALGVAALVLRRRDA